jgi:hypothetical protein
LVGLTVPESGRLAVALRASTAVVPIGRFVGAWPGGPSTPFGTSILRDGEVVEVSEMEFLAWVLSHGTADPSAPPPTRAWLERKIGEIVDTSAEGGVDWLRSRQLLAEFTLAGPDAVSFAKAHRVLPLLPALGASQLRAGRFGIGLPGQELATVDADTYVVWSQAPAHPNLWRTCHWVGARQATAGEPLGRHAERLLGRYLANLHYLLASSAVYVDLVRDAE